MRQTLAAAACDPASVDHVIYATTTFWQESFYRRQEISRLLWELELTRAYPIGVTLSECANVQAALAVGAALIGAGQARTVMVVSTDCTGERASRLVPPKIGIKSDGAASVLLSREPVGPFVYLGTRQVINAALWNLDPEASPGQYLREIGNGIKATIDGLLAAQGLSLAEIDLVIPNNYNQSVVRTVGAMIGVPAARVYGRNIARMAHAIACDNLVNLRDARDETAIAPGAKLLLIGTGPNVWGASLVRHEPGPSAA